MSGNESSRKSDVKGVGIVSGRNADDSHVRRVAGPSDPFGAGVALEEPVGAADAGRGRPAVVIDPPLCRAARYEVPSATHLALSLALLLFAVAVSLL